MTLQKTEIAAALTEQRLQLQQLIAGLSPRELEADSLCAGWSNHSVLSHILSFELNPLDFWLLILKLKPLDDITAYQSWRYSDSTRDDYHRLLEKGQRRVLRLLKITPNWLLGRKFLPVRTGRLSLGQLFGDIVIDRAIHYLDIAAPLGKGSRITSPAVMDVCLDFTLASIDLLNPKIPQKYYSQWVELKLTGVSARTSYWKIGTDLVAPQPDRKAILRVSGDTNDFLFTVTVRSRLIRHPLVVVGNAPLAQLLRTSFNANALWDA